MSGLRFSIANFQQQQPLRRLAISDLLMLIFCVSISLAFIAPWIDEIRKMPDEMFRGPKSLAIVIPVLDHLGIGLTFFGLATLTRERWYRRLPSLSPGHWYFLIAGPMVMSALLTELLNRRGGPWPVSVYLIQGAFDLTAGIVGAWAIYSTPLWRWRVCLGLVTASAFFLSTRALYRVTEISGYTGYQYQLHLVALWGTDVIASGAAAVLAVTVDLLRRARRDWLHYFAIVALLLTAMTVGLAFRPILSRFWLDVCSHFLG